jgi:hypothetical protein
VPCAAASPSSPDTSAPGRPVPMPVPFVPRRPPAAPRHDPAEEAQREANKQKALEYCSARGICPPRMHAQCIVRAHSRLHLHPARCVPLGEMPVAIVDCCVRCSGGAQAAQAAAEDAARKASLKANLPSKAERGAVETVAFLTQGSALGTQPAKSPANGMSGKDRTLCLERLSKFSAAALCSAW